MAGPQIPGRGTIAGSRTAPAHTTARFVWSAFEQLYWENKMRFDCMNLGLRIAPILTLAVFAGAVQADQDVKSSDGMWTLHAKGSDSLVVKKSAEAMIDISPVGMAKGCPKVSSAAFEMPAHGHGGDIDPKVMSTGECSWHVSDLSPSMAGDWRLRLVLKSGEKTTNADFAFSAK
ncbi:hypothetical protein SBBP1_210020 [Burkholderiales bacterium]|nr:hypothetical protein SBBP1_210020 [Burkholderiales bacterium]